MLTPQPAGAAALTNDPAIGDGEFLLRHCKTWSQVVYDQRAQEFILSDQLFAALGPGASIELESLYTADGHSSADRVAATPNAFAAVTVTAGVARGIRLRDAKGKPTDQTLRVAYTPLAADQAGGPNPYHGDIAPKLSGSVNRQLSAAAVAVVAIDQAVAAAVHAARHR
jgi:hypothetical protein